MEDYNPFTEKVTALRRQVNSAEDERAEIAGQLKWYSEFDSGIAARKLTGVRKEIEDYQSKLQELQARLSDERVLEQNHSEKARLGMDPRRWFSADRLHHAKLRDEAGDRSKQLTNDIASLESEVQKLLITRDHLQKQILRCRSIDPLELRAKLNYLEGRLSSLHPSLSKMLEEKERVDSLLSAPLLEESQLSSRLATLQNDQKTANRFLDRLNRARNSYERSLVHQECADVFFGEGSPQRILFSIRNEIGSVERNLFKIRTRLEHLSRIATRQITSLVIDGNNLCYEGDGFIGLDALYVLCDALRERYRVIVVFDAVIRKRLGQGDHQIRHGFPTDVLVHITATRQTADMTVLECAATSDSYVISNDRFKDFPEKSAVKENRLIRHEIVAGQIFVHDLNLSLTFGQSGSGA
jgi:hypothetical protein